MRFSIIVPVYNVERYLGDCISSVLDQTYKDFELILIDDGSSDHSGELCEQFATQDTRIVVIHKENGGLSSARNAGLVAAQGDNIIFLDSDDYWNSEVLLEEIVQADCDGIVCWNYTRVEENLAEK